MAFTTPLSSGSRCIFGGHTGYERTRPHEPQGDGESYEFHRTPSPNGVKELLNAVSEPRARTLWRNPVNAVKERREGTL
jgi:hypothetical protein